MQPSLSSAAIGITAIASSSGLGTRFETSSSITGSAASSTSRRQRAESHVSYAPV